MKRFAALMLATIMTSTIAISATACAKPTSSTSKPTDIPTVDPIDPTPSLPDLPTIEEPEEPEIELPPEVTDPEEPETPIVNITGLSLSTAPTKVEYEIGETLDLRGAQILISYDDDTSTTVDIMGDMCSSVDFNTVGDKTVTVTYSGRTCSFVITVKPPYIPELPDEKPGVDVPDPEEPEVEVPPEENENAIPNTDGLIALPNYTVSDTYPDYIGSENAPVQGSGTIPGWILPNENHSADGDYPCTDPDGHGKQLLEIHTTANMQVEFARSMSLAQFAQALLLGVESYNKHTNEVATVSLTQLDATILGSFAGNWLDLFSEGAHTAIVQAIDSHGRTVVLPINFEVVVTEPTIGFDGETPVCHIGNLTQEIATQGLRFFANGVTADNLAEHLSITGLTDMPNEKGYVQITYTLSDTDETTSDTTVTRLVRVVNLPTFDVPADTKFLLGNDPLSFDALEDFNWGTAYAYGKTLTRDDITLDMSGVDFSKSGIYSIVYSVTDTLGATCTATRFFEIVNAPVFEFSRDLVLHDGDTLDLAKAMDGFNFTASGSGVTEDNYTTHLTVDGLPTGIAQTGEYILTYTLRDDEVLTPDVILTRTVKVVANPSLAIPAAANFLIGTDEGNFDPMLGVSGSAFGIDNVLADIKVLGLDQINYATPQIYVITYSLTDSLGKTCTASRQVIIRDYTKQEAMALYSDAKLATAQEYWEASSTANYTWGNNDGYKTHIYRANTAEGFVFGFAVDSDYVKNLPYITAATTGYACVNDGALLLRQNKDGSISVMRTDAGYNGGYREKATVTTTSNLLNGFVATFDNFKSVCTVDLGTMSAAEVLNKYGIHMSASSNDLTYNFSEATTNSAAVTLKDAQTINLSFNMTGEALDPYIKLMNEMMVTRWDCSSNGDAITLSLDIDRSSYKIISTSISNERVKLKIKADKVVWGGSGKYEATTSTYAYSQTLNYADVQATASTFALPQMSRAMGYRIGDNSTNLQRMSASFATADGSYVYDDGSCSCCPGGTTDEGSVRVDETANVPGIGFTAKLTLPTPPTQDYFYKWLFAGVTVTDGKLYVAGIKGMNDSSFVRVTADTNLSSYMVAGDYVVKYYAVNESGNYTFLNRTISVVERANSGSAILLEGAELPTISGDALKLPANPDMTNDIFYKLLGSGLTVSNGATVYGVGMTDKDGVKSLFNSNFDINTLLQKGAGTYTVQYYVQSNGAYTFFERNLELFGNFDVPRFQVNNNGLDTVNGYVRTYADIDLTDEVLLHGVSVTDPLGENLTITIDKTNMPIAGVVGSSGYCIYTATNSSGKTSTAKRYYYFIDYSKPTLTVNNAELDLVSFDETNFVRYFADAQPNLLAGVSAKDILDGDITSIDLDTSKMPTKDGGFGYVTYTVTNSHGKTATATRRYYQEARTAPVITKNDNGLELVNGKACYYFDTIFTDEVLLSGITADGESTFTIDKSNMPTSVGESGYATFTATNKYGKTSTTRRDYFLKDYAKPTLTIDNSGMTIQAIKGVDCVVYNIGDNPNFLLGVSAQDAIDGDNVIIDMDTSKQPTVGNVGYISYTATNSHGKSTTSYRYYYLVAPSLKVTVDNSTFDTITVPVSGVDTQYVIIDYSERTDDTLLLRGITTNGKDNNLAIDHSKSQVATLDNPYGYICATSTDDYDGAKITSLQYRYYQVRYHVTDMNQDVFGIYNKTENKMSSETYKMMGKGVSDLSIGSDLTVYSTLDHTPTELYIDNVSSGGKIVGQNTSFGARAYVNSATNTYRIGKCSGQGNTDKVIGTNGGDWGLGSADNMSATDFQNKYFGRPTSQLFGYPVNSTSVTSSTFTANTDGTFTIFYKFNHNDGNVYGGYAKQVNTISEKSVKSMQYAEVTMTVDNNFRLTQVHVSEKYMVTLMNATTANKLDYSFTYGNITVRRF